MKSRNKRANEVIDCENSGGRIMEKEIDPVLSWKTWRKDSWLHYQEKVF